MDRAKSWPMDYLTLAEIARELGLNENTVRYRAKLFDEFLPYQIRGKRKVYKQQAVEILEVIDQLYETETTTSIKEKLQRKYPTEAQEVRETTTKPQQPKPQPNLPIPQRIMGALVAQNEAITRLLEKQQGQMAKLEDRITKYEQLIKLYTDHQVWKQRAEKAEGEVRELQGKMKDPEKDRKGVWERLLERMFGKGR